MAVFTVTSTNDLVNGTADGVSLREALELAQSTPGPHTIVFAESLSGEVIRLTSALPDITVAGIAIEGDVVLDFSDLPGTTGLVAWSVSASDTSFSGITFQGLKATHVGIFVEATEPGQLVENITFTGCSFTGTQAAYAIRVGLSDGTEAVGATIRHVAILDSTFSGFGGDAAAVQVQAAGASNAIEDVSVAGSSFTDCARAVELVLSDSTGARIEGTLIEDNDFIDNQQPVSLRGGNQSVQGFIGTTLIARNYFEGSASAPVSIDAGTASASENVIGDTQVENNLVVGSAGVRVSGGSGTGNAVEGVLVINNTFTGGAGVALVPSAGGTGNHVTGLEVLNTIFTGSANPFSGPIEAGQVFNCILPAGPFAGVNGNVAADPAFVDAANGDFRLQAGSPAIDAGFSHVAPSGDIDGRVRIDDLLTGDDSIVDIGAFEFDGSPGDDKLDFGEGFFVRDLAGPRSAYEVTAVGGRLQVNGPSGNDEFRGVERLTFDDSALAFDLGLREAAGATVRIIGAAFGAAAIAAHPDWVGIGISWFDEGVQMPEVCTVVASILHLTNEQLVSQLYTNVIGVAPSPAEAQPFVAWLEAGMTQGELIRIAAEFGPTADRIGVPQMAQDGVEFT